MNSKQREIYFGGLKTKISSTWKKIASQLKISDRMLRSWRSGEFSIPEIVLQKIRNKYKIEVPENIKIKPAYWHAKSAGRKGAIIRYKLYGNPGTHEGRRNGGLNSLKTHILRKTKFYNLKKVTKPKKTAEFAEVIGILIGDGGISPYQVKISLDLKSDIDYASYVQKLFEKLFNLKATVSRRIKNSTIEVILSSKTLVEFLNRQGLPIGNKIKQNIDIPDWIKNNNNFSRACLRGLLDTDGCVYLDRHTINKKIYENKNIAITSFSAKLLTSIKELFIKEGFHPTHTSKNSIRLRREKEIIKFFDIIGSSNPKNQRKFKTLN